MPCSHRATFFSLGSWRRKRCSWDADIKEARTYWRVVRDSWWSSEGSQGMKSKEVSTVPSGVWVSTAFPDGDRSWCHPYTPPSVLASGVTASLITQDLAEENFLENSISKKSNKIYSLPHKRPYCLAYYVLHHSQCFSNKILVHIAMSVQVVDLLYCINFVNVSQLHKCHCRLLEYRNVSYLSWKKSAVYLTKHLMGLSNYLIEQTSFLWLYMKCLKAD